MNNIVEIKIRLEEIENVIAEYKNQLEDLRKHSNNEVLDKEKIDIKVESGIEARNGDKGVYLKDETNKIIINKKGQNDYIKMTIYITESIIDEINRLLA
ncbi:MAG: hypothetical protein ACOX0L_05545 [Natronincolaceae bacterium]|jgi:hypothetical protein